MNFKRDRDILNAIGTVMMFGGLITYMTTGSSFARNIGGAGIVLKSSYLVLEFGDYINQKCSKKDESV